MQESKSYYGRLWAKRQGKHLNLISKTKARVVTVYITFPYSRYDTAQQDLLRFAEQKEKSWPS
jgi:hypothetical protein